MLSRFGKGFLLIIVALFLLSMLTLFHPPSRAYLDPITGTLFGEGGVEGELHDNPDSGKTMGRWEYLAQLTGPGKEATNPTTTNQALSPTVEGVYGGVIMQKLGNATAKAELGRATWKLLHTMTLRFPEEPSEDERNALSSYFHLLSRLYPCGECAQEFQQLLVKFPPQTSSRRAAATWLCHVHNQVNARLQKPEFDCANLDATYDCGCGDDPISSSALPAPLPTTLTQTDHQGVASGNGVEHEDDDPMDLEVDPSRDSATGIEMIKGGRR